MEEIQNPRVLTDDEAWEKGLVKRALSLLREGDLLVGIVIDGKGKPLAVIYTEREDLLESYAWLLPLERR
jgi:hypothetical protein